MTGDGRAAPLPGSMPGNLPEGARPPADFDPIGLAKTLLRRIRSGALGTLDRATGHPVTTLVNVATGADGAPLLLVSRLSSHTANLLVDPRASLLLAESGKGDPLAHPRLTVLGRTAVLEGPARAEARRRFLARHPKSALYADFPDFLFLRLVPEAGHLNGGFARAGDLPGADLLTDVTDADPLIAAEAEAVAHMNGDHADAVAAYATGLLGLPPGAWRLTGLDPDGLDLAKGEETARLAFPRRVTSPGVLQKVLKEMAVAAREGSVAGTAPP